MLNLHHPEQFAGPWSIYEPSARAIVQSLQGIDWTAHQAAHASDTRQPVKPRKAGGVAVIDITGPLSKYGSSVAPTSYLEVRRALRQAVASESISAIMLAIESPGGASMGVTDLADAIAEAAAVKPTHAFIEDLGASAAYMLASQANHISANRSALVGSIGTYMIARDYSRADEAKGITTHVVRAGRFKGVGEPGAKIDAEDLAELQRVTDQLNSMFTGAVSKGRGLTGKRLEAVTDGRVHSGDEAKRLGLIDAVMSFEQAIEHLAGEADKPARSRSSRDPVARWDAAVKSCGSVALAAAQHPDRHAAYLAHYNKLTPDQRRELRK